MTGEGPKIETVSIAPNDDCQRLGHPTIWREVASASGDKVLVCRVCTGAHELAVAWFGDERAGDEFVKSIRADLSSPWTDNKEGE